MFEFGQAWSEVADHQGVTQIEAGRMVSVSNSHVSKIMSGQRKPPKDVMKAATIKFDDPRLHFATIRDITGGAFPEWLDNVNLDPAAVAHKTLEEMHEAMMAIRSFPFHKRTENLTPDDHVKLDHMMEEVREKVCAGLMLMGVMCITHKRSWSAEWGDHNMQMKAKNYVK